MILLSLDISSHSGWAICDLNNDKLSLIDCGTIDTINDITVEYPKGHYEWAARASDVLIKKIKESSPDMIIIEDTTNSRNARDQRFLEWTHYRVVEFLLSRSTPFIYFMTGQWRKLVEAKLTKEEKKKNALVRKTKQKTGSMVAKDENGKRIGISGKKHVGVRKANELFGLNLRLKDNNTADALLLCAAYANLLKATKRIQND